MPGRLRESGAMSTDGAAAGSDGTDPELATGVLESEDTLDGTGDVLDAGWSPAERPWASTGWGTTEAEEAAGESLAGRLARELPDGDDGDDGDGLGDTSDTDGERLDEEVGGNRAGRLSAGDDGYGDDEPELHAVDRGTDGGAASAEEAAVHLVADREDDDRDG